MAKSEIIFMILVAFSNTMSVNIKHLANVSLSNETQNILESRNILLNEYKIPQLNSSLFNIYSKKIVHSNVLKNMILFYSPYLTKPQELLARMENNTDHIDKTNKFDIRDLHDTMNQMLKSNSIFINDQLVAYRRRFDPFSMFSNLSIFTASEFCQMSHSTRRYLSSSSSTSKPVMITKSIGEKSTKTGTISTITSTITFAKEDKLDNNDSRKKHMKKRITDSNSNTTRSFDKVHHSIKTNNNDDKVHDVNTAVCLVGTTRTLLRADVKSSLLYRFYAGWGIDNLYTFAVLSHPSEEEMNRRKMNEKSMNKNKHNPHNKNIMSTKEGQYGNQSDVLNLLSHFNTVALNWYEVTVHKDRTCMESHLEMQLRQWSQCLGLIEDYEKKQNAKFDVVAKLRPDDLWYGPMIPYCSLDVVNTVYIARQKDRWSDQWFSLPRKLANPILDLIHTYLKPYCLHDSTHKYSFVQETNNLHKNIPFELSIFKHIREQALKFNVEIVPLNVPRVLARIDEVGINHDVHEKCARFMWTIEPPKCAKTVLGKDISILKKNGMVYR